MAARTFDIPVADVIAESPDTRSFVLDVPAELAERFTWKAGQFLTVEIPWDDFTIRRNYSLSTAREAGEPARITVKRVADGRMSNWLCDHVTPGTVLKLAPPEGRFVLDGSVSDDVPLVLLGAGSGMTPVLALLKAALLTTRRRVLFLDAHRGPEHALFADEIAEVVAAHDGRVTVHHHLDSDSGFLTQETVVAILSGWTDGQAYVCGPTPFMDLCEDALRAAGMPTSHMHFERFLSPTDPDRKAEQPAPALVPEGDAPASFALRYGGKDHDIPYTPGKTLLDCALDAGVDAPHSCTEGFCGCCMATLVSGDVRMDNDEALTRADIEEKRVLLCQCHPTSAAALRLDVDSMGVMSPAAGGGGGTSSESPSVVPVLVVMAVIAAGGIVAYLTMG